MYGVDNEKKEFYVVCRREAVFCESRSITMISFMCFDVWSAGSWKR